MEWNLWRAPTDNDQYLRIKWQEAGFDRTTVRVYESKAQVENGVVIITCRLSVAAVFIQKILTADVRWEIGGDGRLNGSFHIVRNEDFTWEGELLPLPRFGVRLLCLKHSLRYPTMDMVRAKVIAISTCPPIWGNFLLR